MLIWIQVRRRRDDVEKPTTTIGSTGTITYRSCVMRHAYLAQDRSDFIEPVKCLARSMATPTPGALRDLEKVARYLKARRHLALRFKQQIFPKCITTSVDSDHAGCKLRRRSTTGMVQQLGTHTPSRRQVNHCARSGFCVSEARYFALCDGCGSWIGPGSEPERPRVDSGFTGKI